MNGVPSRIPWAECISLLFRLVLTAQSALPNPFKNCDRSLKASSPPASGRSSLLIGERNRASWIRSRPREGSTLISPRSKAQRKVHWNPPARTSPPAGQGGSSGAAPAAAHGHCRPLPAGPGAGVAPVAGSAAVSVGAAAGLQLVAQASGAAEGAGHPEPGKGARNGHRCRGPLRGDAQPGADGGLDDRVGSNRRRILPSAIGLASSTYQGMMRPIILM